jgi:hypothetical protein
MRRVHEDHQMNNTNTGGPAFPGPYANESGNIEVLWKQQGMTLRDYFAAKAMQADMSTYSEDLIYESSEWFKARAEKWYGVADAMLKARQA